MLFQGQEFGSSAPFLYFADHDRALSPTVHAGRKEFLRQFPSIGSSARATEQLANPADPATFERCKLEFNERTAHAPLYALHIDLLALRREDACFSAERAEAMHCATLAAEAFLVRFFHPDGDRLICVNLGADLTLDPAPEPLLAPRAGRTWRNLLLSEDLAYGGKGHVEPHRDGVWHLTAESASVLREEAT
jgi:maltooligosyltrehalose trehalohydrolase